MRLRARGRVCDWPSGGNFHALQYLAGLVANHEEETYFRITLDIGNYREKRRETLEILGQRLLIRH